MLFLTTGANGTAKTLLTLRDVRALQLKESRPVAYNGRFAMKADFGWKKIDAKDWEAEPDGTIFLFDECQNDFPVRKNEAAPRYVTQLAEHRRRGFDFFLISQHPLNIDAFVRRLIGAPGWHRHHKRASGAPMVSVLEWPSVNDRCEKPGAGETGTVTTVLFPKEVYDWYDSATLHTAKTKIPFRVWVVLATIILAPLLGWYAFSTFKNNALARDAKMAQLAGKQAPVDGTAPPMASQPQAQLHGNGQDRRPMTSAEYAASYVPRIAGVPQSAPRYDELTKPTQAPRPAACVHGVRRATRQSVCMCWSQQATAVDVPDAVCKQIAAGGYFDDTLPPPRDVPQNLATARPALVSTASAPAPEPASLSIMGAPAIPPVVVTSTTDIRDGQALAAMRRRPLAR
jgi:zona occludens toxin